ncbi:MAG: hypothetical protein IPG50_15345 [Myxococcales bacterium]|nr:hypothetical protein [Myxococcales bacterium]
MSEIKAELEKSVERAQALIDDVKVRIHLASMDAKDEWNKLEPRVLTELGAVKRDVANASKSAIDELVGALEKLRAKL